MRVLLLGGTGCVGSAAAAAFAAAGHTVLVFHRGSEPPCRLSGHLHGNRLELEAWQDAFADFAPEVVVDAIAASAPAVRRTLRLFELPGPGRALARMVLLSSLDVYRASGIFHGTEAGAPDPVPFAESAPLLGHPGLLPASTLARLRDLHGWLEEGYDPLGMERAAARWRLALGAAGPQLTILRLAPVYGPLDRDRRLYPLLRRMLDRRPVIVLPQRWAEWRSSRLAAANAAAGILAAAFQPRAAGRVYNLADATTFSEAGWVLALGQACGWRGQLLLFPAQHVPVHLRVHANLAQPLVADSSRIRLELGYRDAVTPAAALASALAWERSLPAPAGDSS
ncbi:MAG: NAD-dependent epimerase/dehydratase family protein, partial [Terriglobales bacterium]